MKLAIQVGHTKGTGALGFGGVPEYDYNTKVMQEMKRLAPFYCIELLVTDRDPALSYSRAARKTAAKIKEFGAELCLELHFNAASPAAKGCEILYFWRSKKSKLAAECFSDELSPLMDQLKIPMRGNGGARSLWYRSANREKAYSGRGGYYAWVTPCACLILEPFFGSNRREMETMSKPDNITRLAAKYLLGALRYSKAVRRG